MLGLMFGLRLRLLLRLMGGRLLINRRIVVIGGSTNLPDTTWLGGRIGRGRRRHQMRMAVGKNRGPFWTNAGLILHGLALIPVVIRRLSGRVGGTVWLGGHGGELARKLLRNVRIIGSDRGVHGGRGGRRREIRIIRISIIVGDGGGIIVLHGKLREPRGGNIRSELVGSRGMMISIARSV